MHPQKIEALQIDASSPLQQFAVPLNLSDEGCLDQKVTLAITRLHWPTMFMFLYGLPYS